MDGKMALDWFTKNMAMVEKDAIARAFLDMRPQLGISLFEQLGGFAKVLHSLARQAREIEDVNVKVVRTSPQAFTLLTASLSLKWESSGGSEGCYMLFDELEVYVDESVEAGACELSGGRHDKAVLILEALNYVDRLKWLEIEDDKIPHNQD